MSVVSREEREERPRTSPAEVYRRRVLELLGRANPLVVLREVVPSLRAALVGIPERELRLEEADGRWSIHDVLQHLIDADIVAAVRVKTVLSHPGVDIPGYDQNAWAEVSGYGRDGSTFEDLLGELDAVRRRNLRLYELLNDEERDRWGVHAERGRESVGMLIRLMAGHDLVHRRQIERIKLAHRLKPDWGHLV